MSYLSLHVYQCTCVETCIHITFYFLHYTEQEAFWGGFAARLHSKSWGGAGETDLGTLVIPSHQFTPSQAAYHTLCSIAMELVGALESSVAGEQVGVVRMSGCGQDGWACLVQIAPEFISGICSRLLENRAQPSSIPNIERPSTVSHTPCFCGP